jgi:hypothetical protein
LGGVGGLAFGLGESGQCEETRVDDDEEAFGACEDLADRRLDFRLVEELAAFAAEVATDKGEWLVEGDGAEIVDLYMAGHGEDIKRAIELAHGLVEKGGDDAAMDMAGRPFVHAVELEVACGDRAGWVAGVGGEDEVEALGIGGAASEAMTGSLVDGGGGGERVGSMTSDVVCH